MKHKTQILQNRQRETVLSVESSQPIKIADQVFYWYFPNLAKKNKSHQHTFITFNSQFTRGTTHSTNLSNSHSQLQHLKQILLSSKKPSIDKSFIQKLVDPSAMVFKITSHIIKIRPSISTIHYIPKYKL